MYRGATPQDVTSSELGLDVAYTIAEILARSEEEVYRYVAGASLNTAIGAYLDLHARDRGLRRQDGETDDQLRERLRIPPRAGTVAAILEAIEAIVGDGVILIELPRKSMYYDRNELITGSLPGVMLRTPPCFYDRGGRCGGGRGVVIALIPASADAVASVTDALRTTVSAGKIWLVQEYT